LTVKVIHFGREPESSDSEQQLRRRTQELAALAETAAIGLHWVGADGRILWANSAELEMLGYREDEYIGHHISEFHEDPAVACDLVERLLRGEKIRGVEARLKCRDGSVKVGLIDSSGLWDEGRFVHSQCFTRDFTEHKQLEEDLRRREAELRVQIEDLRRLHEMSARLAGTFELEAMLREVLSAVLAVHGTDMGLLSLSHPDREELQVGVSQGFSEEFLKEIHFVPSESGTCVLSLADKQRVVVEDVYSDTTRVGLRKLGDLAGFRAVHSTPLVTHDGKTIGVLSVYFRHARTPTDREIRLVDLYARQAADAIESVRLRTRIEQELGGRIRAEEGSRQLAAIVESSEDAIISKDLNGHILSWNAGAERIFGYKGEEVIGKPVLILMPPERQNEEPGILERIRRGERIEHYETVRRRKDGSLLDISLTVSPIRDENGKIVGASKIARDISERKRADETLKRQHQILKEVDQRKNEFLAMLGHELRNPLAAIQNAVEMLTDEDPDASKWAAGVVQRQAALLSRLVDDLVDVARITRGRVELRRDNLDMAPIIWRAVETARPLITERRHALEVAIPEETVLVCADSTRLEQLLVNILTNAAKYTDPGGTIRLRVEKTGTHVMISIQDNGIGISPELLPHIFDLFVQEPRGLDRSRGGLGLGLALSKSLAEMHGGELTVKSDGPGCGSIFTLRLPVLVGKISPAPEAAASDQVKGGDKELPRRVLVVDDNCDSAQGMRRLLERRGFAVAVAHDATVALKTAAEFSPDVFLLDLGLPGKDGYELAQELRKAGFQDAIYIAISGYAQPQDIETSVAAGFHDHMAKPVDVKMVIQVITEARSSSKASRTA
jgi:PAS domain S-box-containing protein